MTSLLNEPELLLSTQVTKQLSIEKHTNKKKKNKKSYARYSIQLSNEFV